METIIVMLTAGFLWVALRRLDGKKNYTVIQIALIDYKEIVDGYQWVGRDAEVVAENRADNPRESGPILFDQICRTMKGNWFVYTVAINHGRIIDQKITPCGEDIIKKRLESKPEIYKKLFGTPETA